MAAVASVPGTISALNIVPVVQALSALGHDANAVLAAAGTSAAELEGVNTRVPASLEIAVWEAIGRRTSDPLIGLRIAEHIAVGALGGYEYLLRNSPTIRAAVEQAQRFERVMDDHTRVGIFEQGDEATLRVWRPGASPHPARGTECLFACLLRVGRSLVPGAWPTELRFAHAAPCAPARFEDVLRAPIRFDQPHNEIAMARSLLEQSVPHADPQLSRVLEAHLSQVLEVLPAGDPFLHRARAAIGKNLRQGDNSLEQLAHALHLSPRTLRRRLEERGTSYRALLDELRHELAKHEVRATETTFELIAERLGFADVSAFYRAFKRWTDTTPAAYRKENR